jgi:hypothetical protein
MKYLDPYSLNSSPQSQATAGGGSGFIYGRVTEVYTQLTEDGVKGINSIKFTPLSNTTGPSDTAYPISAGFLSLPIVGEVVEIYTVPSPDLDLLQTSNKFYYTTVVNIWNNPKDNLYFDTKKDIVINPLHNTISINPILTREGDTLIQGRYGQIIRFTQEQDTGSPRIYLSAGREFESPDIKQIELDINKSKSTVEFIANGVSSLRTVRVFGKSHRNSEKPKTVDTYKGEQVVVSTGRVVLNSKEESTLISAQQSISLSSNTVNLEAVKEICLESPKIFLGKNSMISNNPEPILLGNQVEQYLRDVLDEIIGIADGLSTALTASGDTLPMLNKRGVAASIVLKSLKAKLNPGGISTLKSKKAFTE